MGHSFAPQEFTDSNISDCAASQLLIKIKLIDLYSAVFQQSTLKDFTKYFFASLNKKLQTLRFAAFKKLESMYAIRLL
jgi:hypothetical protein